MKKRAAKILVTLIAAAIVLLVFLSVTSGLIQQWLWMRQVGYLNIFWRLLSVKWSLWGLSFLPSWLSFFIPGLISGLRQGPRRLFTEPLMAIPPGFTPKRA